MEQSYWDLSSILADSVRLPCHFAIDVPGLSHIVGTNQSTGSATTASSATNTAAATNKGGIEPSATTVLKNSRVDLPYWLAELLALHSVVNLSFPRQYSLRVRNALDAQANSVRLRDLNGYWYAVGIRLSSLIEAKDLVEILSKTYLARLLPIYSSCQNLATTSKGVINAEQGNVKETSVMMNDDVDSFGADMSISVSLEMQDFIRGLEDSESVCEY
jgi:GINS complex subunit 3